MMTFLPEFQQAESKDAFIRNHALAPYDKQSWFALINEERWEKHVTAYEESMALIPAADEALQELDQLIFSENYCSEGNCSAATYI